jgi:TRAP-type C4-dicarboxylate transport system permease small subunit
MTSNPIRRVIDRVTRVLLAISTLMLVAIVLINGANVFGRYVLDSPFSWGEEVMLFLMIGSVFLSMPAVTWDGTNIRMDMLARALPERVRRWLEAFADLVSLGVAVLLVYASLPMVLQLIAFDQRSQAANIPMALPQGVIPLGFALAAIALIARQISGKAAEQSAAESE